MFENDGGGSWEDSICPWYCQLTSNSLEISSQTHLYMLNKQPSLLQNQLYSKLSRTFWNLTEFLSLVRRAKCLNCAAHKWFISGLLSGWRVSLRKAFIRSWKKRFCGSELWLQYLYQVCFCASPQKCLCRMLKMCFSRTKPSRFQAQGQSKVTASYNFCVVEAGLVQSYPLYMKDQLRAQRPEIFLIYTFVWLVTQWWSWVQLVFSLCSN